MPVLPPRRASEPFIWPDGKPAAVSLSFDDARPTQLDQGLPILTAGGVKATFYVSFPPFERRIDEWRAAQAAGQEIGNHSVNHPCSGNFRWSRDKALEDYTLERIEAELLDANARIQELTGTAPTTFAYPCGQSFVGRGVDCRSYVPVVAKHFLAGRGFLSESANDPSFCDLAQVLTQGMDNRGFQEIRPLIDSAIERGHWLNLAGHDVDGGLPQATRPEALKQVIDYCREKDVWVDTVAAVAQHIQRARS